MTEDKNAQPAADLPRGVRKVARGWEIELDYPIARCGEEVTTLTIRRANTGDLRMMARYADTDEDDHERNVELMVILMGRMLGLTDAEVETIDADDFPRIQEVIQPHLEKLGSGKRT